MKQQAIEMAKKSRCKSQFDRYSPFCLLLSKLHFDLAMEAMKQQAIEMAKKQLDETVPGIAPMYMKPLFGCCGVYGALKNCMCMAPQSVKDVAQPLIDTIEKNS